MGYPTSVPSFTNKNAGDVLQPAHVNDLQTEVTAQANGLLNGFAHPIIANAGFQSSNSTITTLNLTGGSTFAIRPVMPPADISKAYIDAVWDMASSAASTIAFNATEFQTNSSIHSTGTNPERMTPQSTGYYRFVACAGSSPNSSGTRTLYLDDSSGGVVSFAQTPACTAAGLGTALQVIGFKRFDALGGYVTCRFEQSAASTLSLSSGIGKTWFAMEKL